MSSLPILLPMPIGPSVAILRRPEPAARGNHVLAMDPGSKNFAWAVIDRKTGMPVKTGMLEVDLGKIDVIDLQGSMQVIAGMLGDLQHECDTVVWERYQTRGKASMNNESVNLVIGGMVSMAMTMGYKLGNAVMPSYWKGWWHRTFKDEGKDPWIPFFTKAVPGPKTKTVHMRDACGIGYWFVKTEK